MEPSASLFPSTQWSLLHRLCKGSEEEARAALNVLCRAYWQPLYCVARQKAFGQHDAQDLVQGFFECMLRRETFTQADESTGKLRGLLLCAFNNYCGQQRQRANRQKRGGGAEHIPVAEFMDADAAEQLYLTPGTAGLSVETLYNRQWAGAVLEHSLEALRNDYAERGWLDRYDLLVGPLLQEHDDASLVQIAARTGTTAGALRLTLHRMRRHYRDKIEQELAATLDTDDPRLIREEMVELFKAFT
ncbi:MAG: hypothetical protein JWO08_3941 [Verrucomicrobiaceae bacterium]|nr:hypothetical protein [Verrucomicrobiaceae bacterium]